eukprot:g4404.t1
MFAFPKLSLITLVTSSLLLAACDSGGGSNSGSQTIIDLPLTVSAISGDDSMAVGETKNYTLTIADEDGLESVSAELKDSSGSVVLTIDETSVGDLYTLVLNSTGLAPGLYQIEVTAIGVDAGTGTNSGSMTVSFDVQIDALDAPLTVSEITGDDTLILGESENYMLTISDTDGVSSAVAELKDAADALVRTLDVSNISDTYTVVFDSTGVTPGDYVIEVRATGVDGGVGENSGPVAETIDVTVNPVPNSAPSAENLAILDANAGSVVVGDVLTGTYDYTDNDGDAEGVSTFRWLRNGVVISGATSASYAISALDSGADISFEVTPVALTGVASGAAVISSTVSVSNSAPFASNVTISDDNGGSTVVGDSLSGSYDFSDIDGDTEGTSTFRWLRDGAAIPGATSSSYTLVAADSGAEISFEVTPVAATGEAIGIAQVSSALSTTNSAPVASNVAISDDNGASVDVGDSLSGSYDYDDTDGDAEGTSTFRWLRDGIAISGAASDSYTLVSADAGTEISFEVTPIASAGETAGTAVESSTLSVANAAPAAAVVFPSTSLTTFTNQTTVTVRGTASDSDGTVAAVSVNGVAASTSDDYANWTASVSLTTGTNALTVSVTDNLGASNTSAATLSVRHEPIVLTDPIAIAEDIANDVIYLLDTANDAIIYAFDTLNETYSVISGGGVGSGQDFGDPVSMIYDSTNNVLIVSDLLLYTNATPDNVSALLAVDISTGDRTIIAHNDSLITAVGSGTEIFGGYSLSLDGTDLIIADFTGSQIVSVDVDPFSVNYLTRTQVTALGLPQFVSVDTTATDLAYIYQPLPTPTFSSIDLSTGAVTLLSASGTGTGDVPEFVRSMIFDAGNDQILVADSHTNTLHAIDPTTGNRTVISDASTGSGIAATGNMYLDVDTVNDQLLIATNDQNGVIEMNLGTAARALITPSTQTASGQEVSHPSEIVYDSFDDEYLVLDANANALLTIDPSSGDRTQLAAVSTNLDDYESTGMTLDTLNDRVFVITNNPTFSFSGDGDDQLLSIDLGTGVNTVISENDADVSGDDFIEPTGIALDLVNDRVLVIDQTDWLKAVDITTGARTILSDASTGTGTNMTSPSAVTLDTASEIAYVADDSLDAIYTIDISTGLNAGDRAVLSDSGAGTGADFNSPVALWFDDSNNRLLVADQGSTDNRFFAVDLSTGDRTVLATMGSGDVGNCPQSFEYDSVSELVISADACTQSMVLVDLVTGENVVFSK